MFHNSVKSGKSLLIKLALLQIPKRSTWISVQGPQGPVGPISQKLSFIPNGKILSSETLEYLKYN